MDDGKFCPAEELQYLGYFREGKKTVIQFAKLEGEPFFNSVPFLCQIVGSICTISCVGSLMSIGALSLNRYIHICHSEAYPKIFTRRNSIAICVALYFIGLGLVLFNIAGIGAHTFDRRAVQCIWDRMASYPYTVVFSIVLVWIPLVLIGVCFCRMYIYVSNNRRKIEQQTSVLTRKVISRNRRARHHLAKALFIIYVVFSLCWLPYALLIVIDQHNNFPHEIHVYITTLAHLHPSLNWIVYYSTNRKFEIAFKKILRCGKCLTLDIDSGLSGNEASNVNNNKTIRFLELRRLSFHPAKDERIDNVSTPLERHTVA
ncbi:hypothetical protein CHS0354_032967 [Potamilus streckersoni]|uniref:G-protein coupled receptors family 1 profile domain-containing protein n=1 Tax=Potamilus streckersoni TaxID=2493646 RepID=A0AAE0RX73_9BIVA|nr:hypothetical protein CHS0354_032967 [Potamilus streckersoni]